MEGYLAKGVQPCAVPSSPKAQQSGTVLVSLQDKQDVKVEQVRKEESFFF